MENYYIKITKEDLKKCVDWTDKTKPRFITIKDVEVDKSKVSYTKVIRKAIKEKYFLNLRMRGGKTIGSRRVIIYLDCIHGSNFEAQCNRNNFTEDSDVKLNLSCVVKASGCSCCKFLNYLLNIFFNLN